MKIILAFSVTVNVALLVIMFALKSGYAEQAQASYKVATKAYTDQVAKTVNAQNEFIKKGNLVWQLTFEVTAQNLSKSAFDARIAALDEGKVFGSADFWRCDDPFLRRKVQGFVHFQEWQVRFCRLSGTGCPFPVCHIQGRSSGSVLF